MGGRRARVLPRSSSGALLSGVALALVLASLLLLPFAEAKGKGKGGRSAKRKAHLGGADKAYYALRDECSAKLATEASEECTGTDVKRENCVLRCVSSPCYEKIYGSDPLEEGELDTTRGRLFRGCVRTEKRQEEKERKEAEASSSSTEL